MHRLLRKTKPKRITMALTAQVMALGLAFYEYLLFGISKILNVTKGIV